MEILLLCAIAFAAGQQREQAVIGISPADRANLKEHRRHEKAVRKIAEKHGTPPPPPEPLPVVPPWKEPAPAEGAVPVPGTFRSAYRGYVPVPRTATPMGRRAGGLAARGVAWAKDTGRGAVREYRKRRTTDGHEDPAPVLVPLPPAHPPEAVADHGGSPGDPRLAGPPVHAPPEGGTVPPVPTEPPTVHERPEGKGGVSLARKEPAAPEAPEEKPEPAAGDTAGRPSEKPDGASAGSDDKDIDWASVYAWKDEPPSEEPAEAEKPPTTAVEEPAAVPAPRKPEESAPGPAPEPAAKEEATPAAPDSGTAGEGNGVGRMAAEVTYESVMDESDELSLMCDDDVRVYGRIGMRCEREIGRADALIADARNAGVGESVIGWILRGLEKYQGIHSSLDELTANTVAQGEAVVKAKELLEVGQGLYAGIAKDMDDVGERVFYVSDAVDSEDTSAASEIYETRGA